jgi:hypothetical protein
MNRGRERGDTENREKMGYRTWRGKERDERGGRAALPYNVRQSVNNRASF